MAGLFECQDLGPQTLKGISTPLSVYRVVGESAAQSRFEAAVSTGLTPLVGRERGARVAAASAGSRPRTAQAKWCCSAASRALANPAWCRRSKSRSWRKAPLVLSFAARPIIRTAPSIRSSSTCSGSCSLHAEDSLKPSWPNSNRRSRRYRFPQADTLPLLAALLSLPHPEGSSALTLSPQKQKEKTQEALVAWLVEEAEQSRCVLCLGRSALGRSLHAGGAHALPGPSAHDAAVGPADLSAEFTPPWGNRSYLSQLTLSRLGRSQVEVMVEQVTGGKALPPEVVQQIVAKTDGVPLFVEELTKMVVESGNGPVNGRNMSARAAASAGIPATLQDALMARLDRLGTSQRDCPAGGDPGAGVLATSCSRRSPR